MESLKEKISRHIYYKLAVTICLYICSVNFDFKDKSRAMVACYDWNKESGITDNLKVTLYSAKYREYLAIQLQ